MVQAIRRKLKNQKGFTLIELLAVVVILGILAAIAVPTISTIIDNQKLGAIRADAQQVLNAAKLYSADTGNSDAIDTTATGATDPLASYTDTSDFKSGYKITYSGQTPEITGDATKNGKTITFTNATIDGINSAAKNATTISQ